MLETFGDPKCGQSGLTGGNDDVDDVHDDEGGQRRRQRRWRRRRSCSNLTVASVWPFSSSLLFKSPSLELRTCQERVLPKPQFDLPISAEELHSQVRPRSPMEKACCNAQKISKDQVQQLFSNIKALDIIQPWGRL